MDPIFDSFLTSPTMFVLGFIIAIGLLAYKKIMIFLSKPKSLENSFSDDSRYNRDLRFDTRLVENFSPQVTYLKGTNMDVKNTKEVLFAIDALIFDVIQAMKVEGNAQVKLAALLAKLLADKELQDKFVAAFAEYDQIVPELKELTPEEIIELVSSVLPLLVKYFKK